MQFYPQNWEEGPLVAYIHHDLSTTNLTQVLLAKFTENAVSNLNLSIIELISLVSYRFVSLSAVAIVLVITGMAFPPLRYLGVLYALAVDTFFCVPSTQHRNWNWKTVAEIDSKKKEDWAINLHLEYTYSRLLSSCGTAASFDLNPIICLAVNIHIHIKSLNPDFISKDYPRVCGL